MIIQKNIKKKIEEEYTSWESKAYGSRDEKFRKKTGQFFTPPQLTMQMLEKFDDLKRKYS